MAQQIQFRRDTSSAWATNNPVLAHGELGLETNTGQFKIGNGVTAWASLPYGGLAGPAQTNILQDFGNASDGDVVISSGVLVLSSSLYCNNLTISGSGQIITNGYRIFVKGLLDLTNAGIGAIQWNGSAGLNAISTTGAAAGAAHVSQVLGGGTSGGTGATGVTGAGAIAAAPANASPSNGGGGGAGGASGAGVSAAAAARAGGTSSLPTEFARFTYEFIRGATLCLGGAGGAGGSSGGGDGTVRVQQGGGGGGSGGGMVGIWAKTINRGPLTATGAIQSNGGNGGINTSTPAGNAGGSGGGGGGGGGSVVLFYENLIGSQATNMIQCNGGAGGQGTNGAGTGQGGAGGSGGNSGRIRVHKTLDASGALYVGTNGNAGSAGVGVSGGSGGGGGICQINL